MRVLAASALTAAVGALAIYIYERFFDPESFATGPALSRIAFAFAFTFPFIFVGLVLVGLPITYGLRRFGFDNAITFAIAGMASGALIGAVTASGLPRLQVAFAVYGCLSAVSWWALRLRRA